MKKKKIIFTIIAILIIGMLSTYICASNDRSSYGAKLELRFDKTNLQLKQGETKEIEIAIKNISVQNGIALYNGVLVYDTKKVQIEIVESEEWELYNQENNNITIARKDLENKQEDAIIGKIVITAKEDIEINNQIIKLIKNEITNGEKAFPINDTNIEDIEKEELQINFGQYETEKEEENNYLGNIKPNTTIEELKDQIQTNAEIQIYKKEELITETKAKMQTGMKVKIILDGQEIEEYTVVVIGDLNGDGLMTDIDLLKMERYKTGLDTNLTNEYLKATDIFRDKVYADNKDLLKMIRVLVGLDKLS